MLTYQNENSCRTNYFLYHIFDKEPMFSHFHGCFELLWAMKGSSRLTLDKDVLQLEEGQMCLVMPNQIHSFVAEDDSLLWVCVFSPDLVERFCREIENKAYPHPVFHPSAMLLSLLPREIGLRFADPFLLRACLHLVCHEFYQQVSSVPAAHNADTHTAHQILSYISQHYHQDITLEGLAKEFGLNRHYISTLIGSMTRQHFRAYLNGYRLERAKQLLEQTDLPITDIAYECGFNSLRTFNRVFSDQEGMSPRAYKVRFAAPQSSD